MTLTQTNKHGRNRNIWLNAGAIILVLFGIFHVSGFEGMCADIQVGSEKEFPPFAFIDEQGQAAGFSVDLIKAVAGEMGLPIVITTGSWNAMWNGLVNGQFDLLPIVAISPERRTLIDFSLPHTETFDAFFVRDGNPVFKNLAEAQGKKIVVMKSDAAHHALSELNFQGTPVIVETIPEGLSLVSSGKHDAFLCSKLIGVLTIKKHDIKGLTAGPLIPDYKRVFSFGVKKGSDELREKLNQGLAIVKANGEYERIYEKWLGSPFISKEITLTAQEKAWIERHPVIRLGFTTTVQPFSFIGEDNKPTGMAMDYLEIIRKSTGINFQITETGSPEKIFPLLKSKQIDGTPLNLKTPEREQYLNFTKPYITTSWIVVTRDDYPFIGSIQDLTGKKVGVIKKSSAEEFLKKHSGIKLIKFEDQKYLWESVSYGKTDAVVQNIESAGHFISKLRITNLKAAYTISEKLDVGFPVRKDMPELVNILNKALDLITPEQHAEIQKKWIPLRYEQGVNWRTVGRWFAFTGFIFLSVLITTLIWNRRLAKEVAERRQAEKLLKKIAENYPHSYISIIEPDFSIGFSAGQEFKKQDLNPESFIGMKLEQVFGEYARFVREHYLKAFGGKETEFELFNNNQNQLYRVVPLFDNNGKVERILSVVENITERKRAEAQLKEYSERLEHMVEERTRELKKAQEKLLVKERLAVLGHFSGSISHELRNPLAAIDISVYLLNMKLKNADDKIHASLRMISSNVKKSTDIIQSLLSLSKMEKPKTVETNAGDLISEALDGSKIPETVEVVSDLPDEPVFIAVDPEQIRMALKNIVQNAVQAMEESGKITISAHSMESRVEIAVADTGPGIPPEYLAKIFEPLFSTKTHGIGFGLSITKMIIENHGGTIRAESKPGDGTQFIIILPQSARKRLP